MGQWDNKITGHGFEDPNDLLAHPLNWRIHPKQQQDVLAGAIKDVGFIRSVTVSKNSGFVIDGHLRVALAISAGQDSLPVEYVDLSEAEEAEALAVLDPIAALAATDHEQLGALMADIENADVAVAEMLSELHEVQVPVGKVDPDDVPEPPEEPVAKRGDVWILGRHRVGCFDSTVQADVERLMTGERAQMMWTDPPYGVSYVGKTRAAMTISNDGKDAAPELFADALVSATSVLREGAAFYVAHPPGALSVLFGGAILEAGWRLHETLIWVKDSMVLGHSDYHYKHEPIYYGYTPGSGRSGRGTDGWYGDNSQVSVFEVARPKASREHPTGKPVELIEPHVLNSSEVGGLVYDPFGGSGSSLIAADKTGRKANLMEISEQYVDVICRRFQEYSGVLPVLESTGEEHDFSG